MRFVVIIVVALLLLSSDKEPSKPKLRITPVIRPVLPWRAELDELKVQVDELRAERGTLLKELDELRQENDKLKVKPVVSTPPFQPGGQQAGVADVKKPGRSSQARFPLLRRVFRR
jgi:hypothetical protein|tara:strand:- start:869 stop:1216 length:348 start_codon:yes stop_codon:yes gene_type:complete